MDGPGQETLSDWGTGSEATDEVPAYQSPVVLRRLCYDKELSPAEIAEKLGCGESTVRYWVDKFGIERAVDEKYVRDASRNPASYTITDRGYERALSMTEDGTHEIYIHRLVAIAEHGVEAVKDKIVHHRNKIPWDNRPENLELMTQSEHATMHSADFDDRKMRWRDPHVLQELYVEQQMDLAEIAQELGCTGPTVHKWMVANDIERRPSAAELQKLKSE